MSATQHGCDDNHDDFATKETEMSFEIADLIKHVMTAPHIKTNPHWLEVNLIAPTVLWASYMVGTNVRVRPGAKMIVLLKINGKTHRLSYDHAVHGISLRKGFTKHSPLVAGPFSNANTAQDVINAFLDAATVTKAA